MKKKETIVLPFTAKPSGKAFAFSKMQGENGAKETIVFSKEEEMQANKPYIYTSNGDEISANNVEVNPQIAETTPSEATNLYGVYKADYIKKLANNLQLKGTIYIYSFDIDASQFPKLHFEVMCSKGTYIRSLANDFGKALGSGGYLSALRRTKIGDFSVSDAISPEEFVSTHIPDLRKHPLPPIILTTVVGEPQEKKVLNDRFANRNKTINSQFEREETPPSHPTGELNMEAIFPRRKAQKTSGLQYELRAFMRMFTNTDKAITITLLILFCTVLTLMVIQLNDKKKEIMIEMALTPEDLPQEPPQPEETFPNADVPTNNAKLTTNAYNQADASLQHTDDFKTLDEIMAEHAAQEMAAAKEELVANQKMAGDLIITDHSLQNTTNTPKISDKVNKNTLVKYALAGRVGNIPNPVFTCERDGKVVVSITVDEAGRVTKTAIDRANSTTTDDCLLENSLLYAQKAKFNAVSGKKEQTGTITYIFQSKR